MNKNLKINEEEAEERLKVEVIQLDEENVRIKRHPYKIIENYRDGFDREKLAERYSDVLKKYDYIVGDWGYDQLRLKGFYNKNYSQAKMDQRIENVEDYLLEYCNFGCAYFVLENLKKMPKSKLKQKTNIKRKSNNLKSSQKNNNKKVTKNKKNNFNIRKINKD
ncbi:YutD family protein [Companilactobacillus sp. DQM5]|uniref:YutD family protein n=1 Tax=Companilactobacillus sp. DQM5 TaxID=3463359 RepID=UPI00405A1B28